jgi:hypothetical protein
LPNFMFNQLSAYLTLAALSSSTLPVFGGILPPFKSNKNLTISSCFSVSTP